MLLLFSTKQSLLIYIKIISQWLIGLGIFGVFVLTFLDSAFLPTAGAPDAALIAFSIATPSRWWLFAITGALGSTLGCFVLYLISHKLSQKALSVIKASSRQRIEALFKRYDILTLVVSSLLPPPFPFKPFVLCASAIKFNKVRFFIGLLIGRGLRYGVLAYLAKSYGNYATEIIKQNGKWLLIGVIILIPLVWIYKRFLPSKITIQT